MNDGSHYKIEGRGFERFCDPRNVGILIFTLEFPMIIEFSMFTKLLEFSHIRKETAVGPKSCVKF